MDLVLPGVELVFARFFRLKIELIKEDLPTLDLPHNTTSGSFSFGSSEVLKADNMNF